MLMRAAWYRYVLVKSGVWFDLDQGIGTPKSNNKYNIQVNLSDGRPVACIQF